MINNNSSVQIKLIIMYTIGIVILSLLFVYLRFISHRWFSRFSIYLLTLIIIMVIIWGIVIKLP